jgi:hypothetical protein
VILDDINDLESTVGLKLIICVSIEDKVVQKENDNRQNDQAKDIHH